MRFTTKWKDYELLDVSKKERLERWGDIILIRPDPQIIWNTPKINKNWQNPNAIYHRSSSGGGKWEVKNIPKNIWNISYGNLKFNIKMMNFKHTGIFPEQAVNWDLFREIILKRSQKTNVLNLFAYTGGATIACAEAGAEVCHVDAAKGMVSWARENAKLSNLDNKPIRWIVDDCEKFVLREIKRGRKYDCIIMDPPSYGKGPRGEIWKLEDNLYEFVELCEQLLSENSDFFVINSYSTGLSAGTMACLLCKTIVKNRGGYVFSDEIGIPLANSNVVIPAGSTAIWCKEKIF